MSTKKSVTNLEKHLVKCPSCGKDVLDHMTECPFCHAKLSPSNYSSLDPDKQKKIKRILTIILMIIAIILFLLTR